MVLFNNYLLIIHHVSGTEQTTENTHKKIPAFQEFTSEWSIQLKKKNSVFFWIKILYFKNVRHTLAS